MSQTRIVLTIDHPDDLDNITAETIKETFDEAGDVDWTVEVVSIEREVAHRQARKKKVADPGIDCEECRRHIEPPNLMAALKQSLGERIEPRTEVIQ